MADILGIARRVRKGVRLLDKKVGPSWRPIMRKHAADFDFQDPECCVLGTLEHYSGRLQTLKLRKLAARQDYAWARRPSGYSAAADRLQIERGADYGFDINRDPTRQSPEEYQILSDLWQAEFEKS